MCIWMWDFRTSAILPASSAGLQASAHLTSAWLTLHPRATGRKEQAIDINFWLGILIGLTVGGAAVWYFKVRSLQTAVVTMTAEYRNAEKGRKELEAKSRQHPLPAAS